MSRKRRKKWAIVPVECLESGMEVIGLNECNYLVQKVHPSDRAGVYRLLLADVCKELLYHKSHLFKVAKNKA